MYVLSISQASGHNGYQAEYDSSHLGRMCQTGISRRAQLSKPGWRQHSNSCTKESVRWRTNNTMFLYKIFIYTLTIGIYLASFYLNFGVMYYEKTLPATKRTLANRLLSYLSQHYIFLMTTVHGIIILIETFGELGGWFCQIGTALVQSQAITAFLLGNIIMVLR